MPKRVQEYIGMVGRSWGTAISGPALAIFGLALLVVQTTMTENPDSAKYVRWLSWVTLGAAVLMIPKAQYDVWKQEREKVLELKDALSDSLPKFEVTVEQMTTGTIQGSRDGKNFSSWTY